MDDGEASQTWNWEDWRLDVEFCHDLYDIGEWTEDNESQTMRSGWQKRTVSVLALHHQRPRAACLKLFDRWIILFVCVLHMHATSSDCTPVVELFSLRSTRPPLSAVCREERIEGAGRTQTLVKSLLLA